MNIVFENPDKINGLLTLTVEEADYKDAVEKELKTCRKRANVPGFRPGMVPMGMVKKMYGTSVKMDVINKFVGEQIYKYLGDNKIQMLGQPLPSEKQQPQDLEKDSVFTFLFDIAVAPEFEVKLSGHDKVPYHTIKIDDDIINRQIDMFASRTGSYVEADEYAENDILKGDLRELDAEGNTLEGGVTVSEASIMPNYLKDEDQ